MERDAARMRRRDCRISADGWWLKLAIWLMSWGSAPERLCCRMRVWEVLRTVDVTVPLAGDGGIGVVKLGKMY